MKKLLLLILFYSITVSTYGASWPPLSADDLNAKWLVGDKKQVLAYAEDRINNNPKDLLGLIIEWDYAISFMEIDRIREVGPKLKKAVLVEQGPAFSKRKSWLVSDVDSILKLLNSITPEMAKEDGKKGLINGKSMNMFGHIQDLEADGYFKSENTKYSTTPQLKPPSPPASTSQVVNPVWWLLGAITTIVALVFVLQRKRPKA